MAVSNGKVYYISGYAGGGYYLNRWGSGAVSNHQNVTLYTKTPDPDQQWKLKSVTGGYQILSMDIEMAGPQTIIFWYLIRPIMAAVQQGEIQLWQMRFPGTPKRECWNCV